MQTGMQEGRERMAQRPTGPDIARFREVSPISHVAAVTAPLLLMLGARDRRVPVTDALQYAAALRARPGWPSLLVVTCHLVSMPNCTNSPSCRVISGLCGQPAAKSPSQLPCSSNVQNKVQP